jgi:hypothetical protein
MAGNRYMQIHGDDARNAAGHGVTASENAGVKSAIANCDYHFGSGVAR